MKVTDAFKKEKPAVSFEFFPPKTEEQERHLFQAILELKKLNPDFVSVTYGALGTTREKTFLWAKRIKEEFGIEPVAHLTCIAATKKSVLAQLNELLSMGVSNILALRGDPPENQPDFVPPKDGFGYAKDLIAFIKKNAPEFCIGVAGFPEGHPAIKDRDLDIRYLKEKIDAGGEYVITQLFFDNKYYFDFVEKCRKKGINVPIIPGIMPITSVKQIKRMTSVCGASIPKGLLAKLEKNGNDKEAIEKIGIEQALSQCEDLIKHKVPGIHFFVLNQSAAINAIFRRLQFQVS